MLGENFSASAVEWRAGFLLESFYCSLLFAVVILICKI